MAEDTLTGIRYPRGKKIKPMEFYKDTNGVEWMVVKPMEAHTSSGIFSGYLLRNLKRGKDKEIFVSKREMMWYKKS